MPEPELSAAESQRARILEALAEAASEKGYAATTIRDIASRAGASKRTFYRHFDGKDAALAAAIEGFRSEAEAAMDESGAEPGAALEVLLALMAARPATAKLVFLETADPGEAPGSTGAAVLAAALGRGVESGEGDDAAERAALGGAQALVVDQLIAERGERLPELLPDLLYIGLIPRVGQEEAVRRSRLAAGGASR